MKQVFGWWFPDHEKHLVEWMEMPRNRLLLNGRQAYQGKKQTAALKQCKEFRTAIDVGAHVGLWSFNLAHAFDHVVAVEPVEAHRACFERNTESLAAKIDLLAMALGDHDGGVSMSVADGSSGDSRIAGIGDIRLTTLDALAPPGPIDFIKIDCEGYEENVVRGGLSVIKRDRPVIVVEQKRDMATRYGLTIRGAVDLLEASGYHVALELSGDFIMVPDVNTKGQQSTRPREGVV